MVIQILKTLARLLIHNFSGIPKTVKFNFSYLPFQQAIKFPFLVSRNIRFLKLSGKLRIEGEIDYGMIRIGFGNVGLFDRIRSRGTWEVEGEVIFGGPAFIGHGSKIIVGKQGQLAIGKDFTMMAESSIVCYKKISFGEGCLISWDVLFLDTDFHNIYRMDTNHIINPDKEIRIGKRNWFGCRCLILKGTQTSNEIVIGASTVLNKEIKEPNSIIAGTPATIVKDRVRWSI